MAQKAAKRATDQAVERAQSELESLIGYHLRRASTADMNGVTAALAETGMRPVPLSVFTMIVEAPGITAADICRHLGIQRANLVPILANLESKGLFVREVDPADQRIQHLFPTEAGRAAQAECLARIRAHEENLLRRLTAGERDTLRQLLEKVWREDT